MTQARPPAPSTTSVVDALSHVVVFGADQAGAYRELFAGVSQVLGEDIPSKLRAWLRAWAESPANGVVILTGNAGTGKTAAAEEFARALGAALPSTDEMSDLNGAYLAKDVSGIATRDQRADAFRRALGESDRRKSLMCANEGILRDAAEDLAIEFPGLGKSLDIALVTGASRESGLTIVNVNRQRVTAPAIWNHVLDFMTRAELWQGCEGCPASDQSDENGRCPMRANAEALRRSDTREVLRTLVAVASGEVVPTIREVLAVIAYAICGDASDGDGPTRMWTCDDVRARFRDRGRNAFTATSGYCNLVFGAGLEDEICERSPLLNALRRLDAGACADLEVDSWLRDSGRASESVRWLAGAPRPEDGDESLGGSRSHLDVVRTAEGEMTFYRLGEIVSISEDDAKVRAGLRALVLEEPPAQRMWRRRMLFEGSEALGGNSSSVQRLISLDHAPDLLRLAARVSKNEDVVTDLKVIVKGLNFLVTGHADASEGLVVPEPASLFARNPGSFRRARPAFVHTKVPIEDLRLDVPDRDLVLEILDVDHVEVRLVVSNDDLLALTINPRLYQVIREAETYRGPVAHGVAEMADLRGFYGRVAQSAAGHREIGLQIADPVKGTLVRVRLPHFATHA